MADCNKPLAMPARGNSADPREYNDVTGNAGRDGFTRIARRNPRPHEVKAPWGGTYTEPGSREIDPPVVKPDNSVGFGPYSEDY